MTENNNDVAVFIPARYNSEEIFNKTLADINGKPMVQHVHDRVLQAKGVVDVIVATDHEEIKAAVEGFGGRAVLTSMEHRCGTDRVIEAFKKSGCGAGIVVNVQADEPLLQPAMIEEVVNPLLEDPSIPMSTLACTLQDVEDFNYPFNVKVVTDLEGFALYFSRSPIPYNRAGQDPPLMQQHVGIYAYRSWFLEEYPPTQSLLELVESLEQLRVLENGYRMKVVVTNTPYEKVCVNTQQDLDRVRKLMRKN